MANYRKVMMPDAKVKMPEVVGRWGGGGGRDLSRGFVVL